jgi:HPt (histidine-containing phosphotransfer) domain-containing protein
MAFPKDGPNGGKMIPGQPKDGAAAGKAGPANPSNGPLAGKVAPVQKIALAPKAAPVHPKDSPAVKNFKNYQVITPPNRLRRAMETANPLDGDHPVKRAEKALAQLATQFSAWMAAECERLDAARKTVVQSGLTDETRDALFRAAHDIKGQAATFGYPAVTLAAESLCRLIEHSADVTHIPMSLINQHVDAVRAIAREHARPGAAEIAEALTKQLRKMSDDFLTRENAHRPDYLKTILAPPLAPEQSF